MDNSANRQPLSPSLLSELKSELLQQKQRLERQLSDNDHYGLGESMRDQLGELSAYDNHPADLGSELFERGKDVALNENAERQLSEINEALVRMDNGQYGLCRQCGQPIPVERLQALPSASYCVEHAPDPHESDRRPVEEKLLMPPFGRTSLDDQEQNQFDGEDAWQIVESWGSSNTPAMAENPNISENYDDIEIEADETEGFVESYESFLATDIYGQHVTVVRNKAYTEYMRNGEGEGLLEPDSGEYASDDDF